MSLNFAVDPRQDLVLERLVDVPRHLVWEAWTKPEHLKEWYCPKPFSVSRCEIELRPGGAFHATIQSPEGQEFPYTGCYLEIIPEQRLVWTLALLPDFRPAPQHEFATFTAIITLESVGTGTKYVAHVMHIDESSRIKHETMGFYEGWGTALDQLVAYVKSLQQS